MANLEICILAAVLCLVHGQNPIITITQTEPETFLDPNGKEVVNAIRNQDVSLSCFVENLPPTLEVRWVKEYFDEKGESKDVYISIDMANTDNTKYSIEKPTEFTWTLRIKDIQVWDEGTYVCRVQLTEQTPLKKNREVRVLVEPSLIPEQVSSDMTVTEGEEVNLECNATGRPYPTIEWTRLGGAVLPNGKERHIGDILKVPNIRAHHRGWYRCTVWNSVGRIQRTIALDVKFKPLVRVEAETIYQAPGYSAELHCHIEANPSPGETEIVWTKDGLSYSRTSGKYIVRKVVGAFDRITFELIIDGISEEDYGLYTCMAKNSMSTTATGTLREVRLIRSEEPVASTKIGRIVEGGEWRRRFMLSGSPALCVSSLLTTLVAFLTVLFLH